MSPEELRIILEEGVATRLEASPYDSLIPALPLFDSPSLMAGNDYGEQLHNETANEMEPSGAMGSLGFTPINKKQSGLNSADEDMQTIDNMTTTSSLDDQDIANDQEREEGDDTREKSLDEHEAKAGTRVHKAGIGMRRPGITPEKAMEIRAAWADLARSQAKNQNKEGNQEAIQASVEAEVGEGKTQDGDQKGNKKRGAEGEVQLGEGTAKKAKSHHLERNPTPAEDQSEGEDTVVDSPMEQDPSQIGSLTGNDTSAKINQTPGTESHEPTTPSGTGEMREPEAAAEEQEGALESDTEVSIGEIFPNGSTEERDVHPTMTDREIIQEMRAAWKERRVMKLGQQDPGVWDRRGKLRKKYMYLLRLPSSRNNEATMTGQEKQRFLEGTPKKYRFQQLSTMVSASGNIRKRKLPAFLQPRTDGEFFESPVYKPHDVLPSKQNYMNALAEVTKIKPNAGTFRGLRMSKVQAKLAEGGIALGEREAAIENAMEAFHRQAAQNESNAIKENHRLKKENNRLKAELKKMKAERDSAEIAYKSLVGMKAGEGTEEPLEEPVTPLGSEDGEGESGNKERA